MIASCEELPREVTKLTAKKFRPQPSKTARGRNMDFAAAMRYKVASRLGRRLCCAFHGPAQDLYQNAIHAGLAQAGPNSILTSRN
jgi:hypothetical protein